MAPAAKNEREIIQETRARGKKTILETREREKKQDAAFLAHAHVEDLAHALGEDGGSPLNQRELLGGDAACVVVRRDRVFF